MNLNVGLVCFNKSIKIIPQKMEIKVSQLIETLIRQYSNGLRGSPDHLVDLDTALDDTTFMSKDGSLVSILRIKGSKDEDNEFSSYKRNMDILGTKLAPLFKENSHKMLISYRKEVGREAEIVRESTSLSRTVAKSIGVAGVDMIFDNQVKYMADKIIDESVYLAFWTTTSILSKREKNKDEVELKESRASLPNSEGSQSLVGTYSTMVRKHKTALKALAGGFSAAGVIVSLLPRNKSVFSVASLFNPHLPANFQFIFPDSNYLGSESVDLASASSNPDGVGACPSISSQIIPDNECDFDLDDDVVRVGDRLFTTIEVQSPPSKLVLFNELGDGEDANFPYQVSFWVDSAVGFGVYWKQIMSSFPFPATNKRIKRSIEAVKYLKDKKIPDVEYKISASTWSKNYEELLDRKDLLKSHLTSWGSAQVRNYRGCPLNALLCSTHAVTNRRFGAVTYAPLSGLLPQLPLARRPAIWERAFQNFLTMGGNLFPFSPMSSIQKYWNVGICATMGSGKSVLMQILALSHIFSVSKNGLMPMVGYLDNGFSAKIMIEALRAMIPKEKAHEFAHLTMQNSEEYAFNVLTTRLGLRVPEATQLGQIIAFYMQLLVPEGKETHSDLEALVRQIISDAYEDKLERNNPNMYRGNRDAKLDEYISKHNIEVDIETPYYTIADELFMAGCIEGATLAHRNAVPTIKDLVVQLTQSDAVKNNYTDIMGYNNQPLIEFTKRALTTAIEKYPCIVGRTVIDVENARFIVLDLNDVAKGGSDSQDKESEVFYSLGRLIVSKNMFVDKSILAVAPKAYQQYYSEIIDIVKTIPKLLAYDEFHRVKSKKLLSQIQMEMREGRKWSLVNMFASQLLRDFESGEMKELLSSIFILSNDVSKDPREMKKTFDLNSDTYNFLMTDVNGPQGQDGANIIGIFKTKTATITQRLKFILFPFTYWATTSDGVDNEVRRELLSKVSLLDGLSLLMKKYPFGCRESHDSIQANHKKESVRVNPVPYMVTEMLT
ncbi:hypothetical protein ACQKQC_18495 [Vibrio fortis]|uniref:hypothetical protein n=1 Tax=Vibrio fortis TaxID=212667 RepID=UPI004067DC87